LPMMWDKILHAAALAHVDIGTGEVGENQRLAAELMRLIAPLMRSNSVVVGDPSIDLPDWHRLPLPTGVRKGRYHLYRRSLGPSDARPVRARHFRYHGKRYTAYFSGVPNLPVGTLVAASHWCAVIARGHTATADELAAALDALRRKGHRRERAEYDGSAAQGATARPRAPCATP